MHPMKTALAVINVLGGIAVLSSYAYGIATNDDPSAGLWGGVPRSLRPLYTVSMLTAATGYFLFSYFVFFRLDADHSQVFGGVGYGAFFVIYAAILVPSALWMPLTFALLNHDAPALWPWIRIVLAIVGISSVALVIAIATAQPTDDSWARPLALIGACAFAFQTAVLDALVWPAYFPV